VHATLQPHSMATNEAIVKKIEDDHSRLSGLFDKKLEKLELEMKKIKDNLSDIDQMKESVGELLTKVNRFDPYEKYTEELDQEFVALQLSSQQLKQNAEQMIKSMSKSYLDNQNFVPSDLQSEIDNLESILEQLLTQINEKSSLFNKAKKMKQHFLDSLDHLKKWLENAEVQVENQNYPLEEKKVIIAQTRDEYDTLMADDFKKLAAEGERLKESCGENDEQDIVRALQEIATELKEMEGKIHTKYDEVEKALDLRSKFLIYYNDILEWAAKVEKFTNKPLHCQSLKEIRNLCAKYTVSDHTHIAKIDLFLKNIFLTALHYPT
jgi:chromosome segregation ATPase